MNKARLFTFIFAAAFSLGPLAQPAAGQPEPSETPSEPFSNVVPERSAWTVTITRPGEDGRKKGGGEEKPDEFASSTIKKIQHAYASGLRKETIHFADGSRFDRYVTNGMVLYEDRTTGEPVLDDPSTIAGGSTSGVDRLEELGWVGEKSFAGVATYRGRPCYLYHQLASQVVIDPAFQNDDFDVENSSNSGSTRVVGKAFIDQKTMQPVAYETDYETRSYETAKFRSFGLPASLRKAVQRQAEAVAAHKQRYNVPQ